MVRLDFSRSNDNQVDPLPPGEYTCFVRSVTETTTRNGDPMWKVTYAVEKGEFRSRWIFDNFVFSNAALPYLREKLEALGLACGDDMDLEPSMLEGRRVTLSTHVNERGYTEISRGGYARATEAQPAPSRPQTRPPAHENSTDVMDEFSNTPF